MNDDQKIKTIIDSLRNFALRDIIVINQFADPEFPIAVFILCSCFIDQVSGFRYNNKQVACRYQQFINDYMPKYDAEKMYKDIRCKLVHNYSSTQFFSFVRNSEIHLMVYVNKIILSATHLVADLQEA